MKLYCLTVIWHERAVSGNQLRQTFWRWYSASFIAHSFLSFRSQNLSKTTFFKSTPNSNPTRTHQNISNGGNLPTLPISLPVSIAHMPFPNTRASNRRTKNIALHHDSVLEARADRYDQWHPSPSSKNPYFFRDFRHLTFIWRPITAYNYACSFSTSSKSRLLQSHNVFSFPQSGLCYIFIRSFGVCQPSSSGTQGFKDLAALWCRCS